MARFPPILLLALVLVLGATVCLWLVTFSTPFLKSIYFLTNNRPNGGDARFGVFGWCVPDQCLPSTLGYSWNPQLPGGSTLTRALVLFPIATALSTLSLFSLLATLLTLNHALITWFLTVLAFVTSAMGTFFAVGIFKTARHRFGQTEGIKAGWGPAMWMSIASMLALLIAMWCVFFGAVRQRHYRREAVSSRRERHEYAV